MRTVSSTVMGNRSGTADCCTTNAGRPPDGNSTLPAVVRTTPATAPSNVDLPAPLGPTIAVTAARGNRADTSVTTGFPS
ncbi:hypothetical protein BJF85_15370 [Saccharomonospora sp. CUA-673]|nr:hypothetical protein BJF85_15370 [Saccharomonospora sp. CUA-673]